MQRKMGHLVGGGLILSLLHLSSAAILYEVYQVRKGDTLESVAKRYGIEVSDLKAANKSLATESLKPNQFLTIPLPQPDKPPPPKNEADIADLKALAAEQGKRSELAQRLSSSSTTRSSIPLSEAGTLPPPFPNEGSKANPLPGASRVGVLGIVRRQGAKIRSNPRSRATAVFTCSKGTQLVIVREQGSWYGVMMIDGSIGWVERTAVDLTGVELVQSTQTQAYAGRPDIVQMALAWLGTPYKYGGTSPQGIDCSALVMNVFRQFGIRLPRTAREQSRVGQTVTWDQLLPGDRLYFSSNGTTIDHTGLYMGQGQFVHASGRRGMVGIDTLADPSYWRMFVGAKR